MNRLRITCLIMVTGSGICLGDQPSTAPSTQPAFEIVGHIAAPEITESSGLVASRKYPGVFWTHNDSGNSASIFAITRSGELMARFPVRAKNVDWEDMAIDDAGHLFLADIGNNAGHRKQVEVYRIAEPDPHGPVQPLAVEATWRLTYPQEPFDAESLFVLGDWGYVISKLLVGGEARLYRFSLAATDRPIELVPSATLPVRIPVTAADISPDGRWLAVMTVAGPRAWRIEGDVSRLANTDRWSAIFLDAGAEGICFLPDGLLASTERRRMVFFPFPPAANATTRESP